MQQSQWLVKVPFMLSSQEKDWAYITAPGALTAPQQIVYNQ